MVVLIDHSEAAVVLIMMMGKTKITSRGCLVIEWMWLCDYNMTLGSVCACGFGTSSGYRSLMLCVAGMQQHNARYIVSV